MSREARCAAWVAIVTLVSVPLAAEEKGKSSGGDATQSFDSPLPLVSGVTLHVGKENAAASLGISKQGRVLIGNYWQLGITGTATDSGDATVYSQGEGIAPGVKAKFGIGYSSFQAEATNSAEHDRQVDRFLGEAWCLDVMDAAGHAMPEEFSRDWPGATAIESCAAAIKALQARLEAWRVSDKEPHPELREKLERVLDRAWESDPGRSPGLRAAIDEALGQAWTDLLSPENAGRKKVEDAVDEVARAAAAGFSSDAVSEACVKLKDVAWATAGCKKGQGETAQANKYPTLHAALVTIPEKALVFHVSANWTPALAGVQYRPIKDGVADLADKKDWTGFLNGGSIDASLAYRRILTGVQIAYADKLDEDTTKPLSVCQRTTQGDYYYDKCKSAALGEPEPFASLTIRGAIALDPLVPVLGASAFRPGAQLNASWERLQAGKRRYTVNLPIYLARVKSPFDLVVGVQPSYIWNRGTVHTDDFSVSVFVGARP